MEWITVAISFITNNIAIILQVIGAFAALAMLTPNTADDKIVAGILKAVNVLGGNIGNAANDSEAKPK